MYKKVLDLLRTKLFPKYNLEGHTQTPTGKIVSSNSAYGIYLKVDRDSTRLRNNWQREEYKVTIELLHPEQNNDMYTDLVKVLINREELPFNIISAINSNQDFYSDESDSAIYRDIINFKIILNVKYSIRKIYKKNNDGVGRVPILQYRKTNEMSYLDLEDGVGGENVETIEFNDQTYTKDLDGDFLKLYNLPYSKRRKTVRNCSIKLPTSAKEDDQITIIQGTHHVQNYNSFVVVAEKPSSSNPVILTSFTRNVSIVKCHFNGVEWDTYSVDRVDVIDNFTSSIPSTALSSNKGRELNEKYIEEKSNREAADAKLKDLIDKSKGKGKDDPHKFDQFVKINDRPGAGVAYDQSSMQKRSASYAGASITTTKGVDDLTFDAGTRNVDYPRFTTDSATTKVRVKDFADFKLCIDSTFYHGRMDIEHPITTKSNTFYTFDIYIDGLKPSRIDITSYDGPSGSTFKEFSHTHWFYSNTKTNLIHVIAVADSTTTVQGTMDVSLWFDTVGGGSCKTITNGYVTDLIEVPLSDAFTYQDAVHNKIPFHDKVNEFRGYTKEVGTKLATANNGQYSICKGY